VATSQTPATPEYRPATTTFFGDTGLWFVPTAEVLGHGKYSVSGYRRGTNWVQGYTNVGDFAGTFGIGIKDRAEIFGSFLFDTRIDRDVRPLFIVNNPTFGGVIDRYPRVNQYWTGDNVGDFYVGEKWNLWYEYQQKPAAIALRGIVKLPTGKKDVGNGRGRRTSRSTRSSAKELKQLVELSGFGGYEWRGQPDGFDTPGGAFRWGAGVRFPSRNFLRVTAELNRFVLGGHDDDHERRVPGDRQLLRADGLQYRESDAGDVRADGAGEERVLRRRRRELERAVDGTEPGVLAGP
jgi:hypothetical protein